ncbi:MAG: GH3 auxin-responsive promoter family protein [Spirochaetales bacterium]|nr:GH3 auxin-responsive promoter family protein [Spirochaetales bacterium]
MSEAARLVREGRTKELWERYCGYLDFDPKAFMDVQRKLLAEQLGRALPSALWTRLSRGRRPKDADELRRTVPLTSYRDYAESLLPRDESVLAGKPRMWVRTSGRSGEYDAKWVPWSDAMYEEVGTAFLAAFIVASAKRKGDVSLREGMTFPYLLAPTPYISGVISEAMLEAFPFKVLPKLEDAYAMDFQERIMAAFEKSLSEGLDFFWGMTSILMKLGERFGSREKGASPMKLPKDPRALFRIVKALAKAGLAGRGLMPKDIWKVKGAICGGMDTALLKDKVAELWGVEPMEGYGCTEFGAIAFQSWSRRGMTFYPYMNFWEFVDEKDYRRSLEDPEFVAPSRFMDEVEAGAEYVLVGTNFHGGSMLRYVLGDLVRIDALEDAEGGIRLPQMTFSSRIDGLIDIAGFTRLTEKTIWTAIERSGVRYEDWSARKETVGERPVLRLYLETKGDERSAGELASLVHAKLRELDAPYRDMEDLAGMRPLEVTLFSKGTFARYFAERQAAGADLAHTKPPHVNAPDRVVESLVRMSDWKI